MDEVQVLHDNNRLKVIKGAQKQSDTVREKSFIHCLNISTDRLTLKFWWLELIVVINVIYHIKFLTISIY